MGGAQRRFSAQDLERIRARLGRNTQPTGFGQAPIAPQQESGGISGALASGFRRITPQGVRDVAGTGLQGLARGFGELDRPISDRLGIRIGDAPGPIDEVGNFLLEEATRPTTLGIALGGAGLAGKLGASGVRGAGLAANLIEPIGGTSLGSRVAAETLFGAGARAGGEAVSEFTEGLPAPIRIVGAIGGGVLGGGAVFGASRRAVRQAVGRDILLPPIPNFNATGLKLRPGEAGDDFTGELFKMPNLGQLNLPRGTDDTLSDSMVKPIIKVMEWTKKQEQGLLDATDAQYISRYRTLGPTAADSKTGQRAFTMLNRVDGDARPAYAQEVLEFPDRFAMSPEQRAAVTDIHNLYRTIFDEGGAHNLGVEEANLIEGQGFVHRGLPKDEHGNVLSEAEQFSHKPRARQFTDPGEAIDKGQKYGDPLVAFREYASRTLGDARERHMENLLIEGFGERWTDRIDPASRLRVEALSGKVSAARKQLIEQDTRGGTLGRFAERLERLSGKEGTRAERAQARLDDLLAKSPEVEDVAQARRDVDEAIRDARALATEIAENADHLRNARKALTAQDRQILARSRTLQNSLEEIEGLRAGGDAVRDSIERSIVDPLADATPEARLLRAGEQSIDKEWERAVRDLDKVEREISDLTEAAADMNTRVDTALEQNAILRNLQEGNADGLLAARRNERDARDFRLNARSATREVDAFEGFQARLLDAAQKEGDAQAAQAIRRTRTEGTLERLKGELEGAREEAARVSELAKKPPLGRGALDSAAYPHFRGVDFPEKVRNDIAAYYTRNSDIPGQLGRGVNAVKRANRILTPARAAMDLSVTFNQLLPFAAGNPRKFVKALGDSLTDAVTPNGPKRYDDWVAHPEVLDAAQSGVAIMSRGSNPLTDFEFDNWLERIGTGSFGDIRLRKAGEPGSIVGNKALAPIGTLARRGQIQFQSMSTRMRVEVFNAQVNMQRQIGKPLSTADKLELGRGLNMISGVANSSAGNFEQVMEFAPNFLRANMETVVSAASKGNIEGQIARQYVRNWVGLASFIAVSGAIAIGRDPKEVLTPFSQSGLENGEIRLNPNFLTVRVKGHDVSLMGRLDSLARLSILGGDAALGVISEQSFTPVLDAADYFVRTKGSPVLSLAADVTSGHTFLGEDISNPAVAVGEFLPFTAQGFLDDFRNGMPVADVFLGALANGLGAKANPSTAFERIDQAARNFYGVDYDKLTGTQKQQLEAQLPRITREFERQNEDRANTGDPNAKLRIESKELDEARLGEEGALTDAFISGAITRDQWADRLDELQRDISLKKRTIAETLDVEFKDSRDPAKQALGAWYDLYDRAKIAGTQVVDWDIHSDLEGDLFGRIAAGEFGDPNAAMQQIQERRRPEHTNERVVAYFNGKDVIQQSAYYSVRDEEFDRMQATASRIAQTELTSYGQLLNAISLAELNGNRALERRLTAIKSRITSVVTRRRRQLRARDRTLDEAVQLVRGVNPLNGR